MNNLKYFFFLISLGLFSACANSGPGNIVDSVIPDTTGIPELINRMTDAEIDVIIDEETLLDGKKRPKGFVSVPQSGDDFRRAKMDRLYWPKVVVHHGDFRGASVRSGRCVGADFHGSDFRGADIRWTILDEANLTETNFSQARLFHVHVGKANLSNSNFRGANMFGMEGHFANMTNCDFSGALMKDSEFVETDFTGSIALKAVLFRAVLKDSKVDSCDFSYADFTGAGLEGSTFRGTKLIGANFQGGHLQGADFSGADLRDCNFFGTEFEGTNFKDAKNIPEAIHSFINKDGMATGIWQDAGRLSY